MRKRLLLLCAGTFFLAGQIRAQWVVTDPGNLAQSIINMSDNIVHTSSTATSTAQNFAETVKIYQQYREQKDRLEREAMLRNPETAYLVSDEEFDRQLDELGWSPDAMATRMGMYMEVGMYNLEKNIRDAFRSLLELLFAAASLLIDTVRTFFLVVLSILGPIAFAFSVWDGFQSTLSQWFTRYISVYLWLPVSDLFSCMLAKIQVLMLQNDILELQNNPNYSLDNSNSVYVIFMLIGIIGYFTVPTVAGWIVQAGGAGNYNRNINRTATKAGGFAAGAAGSGLGNIGGRLRGK